jgi:hypothetical protein
MLHCYSAYFDNKWSWDFAPLFYKKIENKKMRWWRNLKKIEYSVWCFLLKISLVFALMNESKRACWEFWSIFIFLLTCPTLRQNQQLLLHRKTFIFCFILAKTSFIKKYKKKDLSDQKKVQLVLDRNIYVIVASLQINFNNGLKYTKASQMLENNNLAKNMTM